MTFDGGAGRGQDAGTGSPPIAPPEQHRPLVDPYAPVALQRPAVASSLEHDDELSARYGERRSARPSRRPTWLGWVALALAGAAVVLLAAVYVVAPSAEVPNAAIALAAEVLWWAAVAASGLASVLGAIAVIVGWSRTAGAFGLALGLFANPFVFAGLVWSAQTLTPY